jgi:biopolymer transport protein ExbD
VKLDMPQTPTSDVVADPVIINLEILFDGTVLWNGNEIPSVDALEAYFRREAAMDPQPELHIRPNKRANYDVVARVLASAQRNRMLKIGLIGAEEFM